MRAIALAATLTIAGCYASDKAPMPEYHPEECDTHVAAFEPTDVEAGVADPGTWMVIGWLPWDPDSFLLAMSSDGPTTPGTTEIRELEAIEDCSLCIFLTESCTEPDCPRVYATRRGVFQIHEIEMSPGGRIRATLTEAHLIEWDDTTRTPVPDGLSICIDVWEIDAVFAS